MSTAWDPRQYLRFGDERGRPFWDLVGRVPADSPGVVVDLGCGPGNMTVQLHERWPGARVTAVDSSAEMIARASEHASASLSFVQADLRTWEPEAPLDVLLTCATLQWVPGHQSLFGRFLAMLGEGGVFAFHVPGNFGLPSHVLLHQLAGSERWREVMAPALAGAPSSLEPDEYLRLLLDAGAATVDVWETTYLHLLSGTDPVLEWITATGLRPFLQALEASNEPSDKDEFLRAYAAALRAAYPQDPQGRTVFPFRRIFAVARV